ncbi:MAG TPA: pyridoxamine 5'-phosphate oxidase family protein [Chitinophagaceae bacterium]|nr:pyridoxamine 5'-phosphate oxidase family protein [Chitinophagaceae bacterium]
MLGTLSDKQIDELLFEQVVGRLGCYAKGKLYVVPVTYVFDGKNIICHTREGLKLEMMRENPSVCFEVDIMENMANWRSVIVWGTFRELSGKEAEIAMQKMLDRLQPLLTSETARPHDPGNSEERRATRGLTAIMYEIIITEKTGRFEKR